MTELNLSSNSVGSRSCRVLTKILRSSNCSLEALDLTCNELNAEDIADIRDSLMENTTVMALDLRANRTDDETNEDLKTINSIARRNELSLRSRG